MPRDDAEFSAPSQEEFDDFVARTGEETGRLAFALTGDEAAAAALAERAYADARPLWASGEQATRQRVRERLLHHARTVPGSPEALEAVSETGWPPVDIDAGRIASRTYAVRSRRKMLGLGASAALVVGLGAGAWQTRRWVTEESAAPASDPSGLGLGLDLGPAFARRTVRVDRLLTVELSAHGNPQKPSLAITHDDRVLGVISLPRRQALARLDHPENEFQALQVAVTPPAEWIQLSGAADPLMVAAHDFLGHSIAVESIMDDWYFNQIAAGLRSGDFLGWPGDVGIGWKLAPQLWAHSLDGMFVVHRGEARRGTLPIEDLWGLWSCRQAEWGLVVGVEGGRVELQGVDPQDYRWFTSGEEWRLRVLHIPEPGKYPRATLVAHDQQGKTVRVQLTKL